MPITLAFESHGAFFSSETHQPVAIDPQVFVQTPGAAATVGPQNIPHAAGFAPAPLSGPPDTPLYTALSELWRVAFRRTYYTSLVQLERDLQAYLRFYNRERSHQGYRLQGRTPAAVFAARKVS